MFNPAGPEFNDGRLNPFSNPKVREAVNWLIDRNYLAQEAIGPMGKPMTVVLVSSFPDYVRYVDIIRPLEAKYSYNFEKAKEVIRLRWKPWAPAWVRMASGSTTANRLC